MLLKATNGLFFRVIFMLAIVSYLFLQFFKALPRKQLPELRQQALQAFHRCGNNVLRVVGTQAPGTDVAPDAGSLNYCTNSAAGNNAGTGEQQALGSRTRPALNSSADNLGAGWWCPSRKS